MREEGLPPMKKGDVVDGHEHNFGHITYVPKGAFLFEAMSQDDRVLRSARRKAGEWIFIEAGQRHRLTAEEDGSEYHCLYAHREPESGAVVRKFMGWTQAYE